MYSRREHRKKGIKFFILLLFVGIFFISFNQVFAQEDTFGVEAVEAGGIHLAGTDLKTTVVKIIRAVLGLLGLVAVGIVLYGGFIWMTSAGNEEKITRAKKILINGVIGLVIILSAFTIVQFIINILAGEVGEAPIVDTTKVCDMNSPDYDEEQCNELCQLHPEISYCKDLAFYLKSITPSTPGEDATEMNNIVVRALFSHPLDPDTDLNTAISIENAEGAMLTPLSVSLEEDDRLIEATYDVGDGDLDISKYTIKVSEDIKDVKGQGLIGDYDFGGISFPLSATADVNQDFEDNVAPEIGEIKLNGQSGANLSLKIGDVFAVETIIDDITQDAPFGGVGLVHISIVEDIGDQESEVIFDEYRDAPPIEIGSTPEYEFLFTSIISKSFKALKDYIVKIEAWDIDNNMSQAQLTFTVYGAHCDNGIQDGDEEDVDVGGSCGGGIGDPCKDDTDCAGDLTCSLDNICVGYPIIQDVNPMDGAPGNWITITGVWFGIGQGSVSFAKDINGNGVYDDNEWIDAVIPECVLPGANSWNDNYIIAEVPYGFLEGDLASIRVLPEQDPISPFDSQAQLLDGAVYLDGDNDYISFENNPLYFSGDIHNFSISTWIKPSDILDVHIVASGGITDEHGFILFLSNNLLQAQLLNGEAPWPLATGEVAVGEWTHVALTYNSQTGEFLLYINGEKQETTLGELIAADVGNTLTLGKRSGVSPYYYGGLIDEFALFDTALTEKQIKDQYTESKDGTAISYISRLVEQEPTGYWHLNELEGTLASNAVEGGIAGVYENGVVLHRAGIFENKTNIFSDGLDILIGDITTNDIGPKPGPKEGLFEFNNTNRPGLCAVLTAENFEFEGQTITEPVNYAPPGVLLDLAGTGFGQSGSVSFAGIADGEVASWSENLAKARIPVTIAPDKVPVYVVSGGQASNALPFTITSGEEAIGAPIISNIDPPSVTPKSYISIFGSSFDGEGSVFIADSVENVLQCDNPDPLITQAAGCIELNVSALPSFCGDTWKDTQVIAEIPEDAPPGIYNLMLKTGATKLKTNGLDTITIYDGPPLPSICSLVPGSGPAPLEEGADPLTLRGINFSLDPTVYFSTKGTVPDNLSTWMSSAIDTYKGEQVVQFKSDTEIRTRIPVQDSGYSMINGPGFIKVESDTNQISNSVQYIVSDCRDLASDSFPGYKCCDDGADAGTWIPSFFVCEGEVRDAGYVWRFTSGILPKVPRVVEQCDEIEQEEFDPDLHEIPSPTPFYEREDGENVCTNASISARFNMDMDEQSFENNVKLYSCESIECIQKQEISITSNYLDQELRVLYYGDLQENTWYRIELLEGIQSKEQIIEFGNEIIRNLPLLKSRPCGEGTAYCFEFKTGIDKCKLTGVGISPPQHTTPILGPIFKPPFSTDLEDRLYYRLWGKTDQACIIMDVDGLGWQWSTTNKNKATVEEADLPDVYTDTRAQAEAHEHSAPQAVTIKAEADVVTDEESGETVNFVGKSDLYIDLGDPKVVYKEPECEESCVNAIIRADFNRHMATQTYIDGIHLFECNLTDPNCTQKIEIPITEEELADSTPFSLRLHLSKNLDPNTRYMVSLGPSIKSISRLDPLKYGKGLEITKWFFKTKDDAKPCQVNVIEVLPDPFTAYSIGQKTKYSSIPFSSPNQCSSFGQPLNPYEYTYDWSTKDSSVAQVSNFNVTYGIQPYCSQQCLPVGSNIPIGADMTNFALCGNGEVDFGEDCDIAIAGESPNSCSINCLRAGNTDTTCGNGIVEPNLGEQCDPPSVSTGGASQVVLDMNFEKSFTLEENQIEDNSDFDNHAIVEGAVFEANGGHDGNAAYRFDDGQVHSIRIPHDDSFVPGEESLKLSLWFKGTKPGSFQAIIIKSDWDATVQQHRNRMSISVTGSDRAYYVLVDGDGNTVSFAGNIEIIQDIDEGGPKWHHISMIIDRQSQMLRTYVDGVFDKQASIAGLGSILSVSDMYIGAGSGFAGYIDDLLIEKGPGIFDDICSQECLLLGAKAEAKAAKCGNGVIELNETCDSSVGCSNECLKKGTPPIEHFCQDFAPDGVCEVSFSVCGNGFLEKGEECEVGINGVIDEICSDNCLFENLCDLEGSLASFKQCEKYEEGCSDDCTWAGSSIGYSIPSVCGDGVFGIGEFDGGYSCEGSTEDPSKGSGPIQFVTAIGQKQTGEDFQDTQIVSKLATDLDIAGDADYRLQCGFTEFTIEDEGYCEFLPNQSCIFDSQCPSFEETTFPDGEMKQIFHESSSYCAGPYIGTDAPSTIRMPYAVLSADGAQMLQLKSFPCTQSSDCQEYSLYEGYSIKELVTTLPATDFTQEEFQQYFEANKTGFYCMQLSGVTLQDNSCVGAPDKPQDIPAGVYNDCPNNGDNIFGVATNSCCLKRPLRNAQYPDEGAGFSGTEKVCRNTYIEATFDGEIKADTLSGNIMLATGHEDSSYDCFSEGGQEVTNLVKQSLAFAIDEQPKSFWKKLWYKIKSFFARLFGKDAYAFESDLSYIKVWCAGGTSALSDVIYEYDSDGKVEESAVSIMIDRILEPNMPYAVILKGGKDGIANTMGVAIKNKDNQNINDAWVFHTSNDYCKIKEVIVEPDSYLFQKQFETAEFEAAAVSEFGNQKIVPTVGYRWEWSWGPQNNLIFDIPIAGASTNTSKTTIGATGIPGKLTALAKAYVTEDVSSINNHTGKIFSGTIELSSLFCERPWPQLSSQYDWQEYEDKDFNFSMNYCADAGIVDNIADDLPFLEEKTLIDKINNPQIDPTLAVQYSGTCPPSASLQCNVDADCPDVYNMPFANDPNAVGPFTAQCDSGFSAQELVENGCTIFHFPSGKYCAGTGMSVLYPPKYGSTYRNCSEDSDCDEGEQCASANDWKQDGFCKEKTTEGGPVGLTVAAEDVLVKKLFLNDKNDDVIGLQIFLNEDKLSASEWFRQKFLSSSAVQSVNIAGYDAVTDGNNYYINAMNKPDEVNPETQVYNNIYLFSINEYAQAQTREVFETLLESLEFNTNMTDYGYCLNNDPTTNMYETPENFVEDIACSSDFDCVDESGTALEGTSGICSNMKTKFFRDWQRLSDVKDIQTALSVAPPALSAGTYIPNYTVSKWPSWNIVGDNIVDPLNMWTPCDAPDQQTCWNPDPDHFTYACPALASVYEYNYNKLTGLYELHVPFEYFNNKTALEQQFDEFIINPSSFRIDRWCEGEVLSPFGGECGDSVVNPGEMCDPPGSTKITTSEDCAEGEYKLATCNDFCALEYGSCQPLFECGNGKVEGSEVCDDGPLNGTYGHCAGPSSYPGEPEKACNAPHPAYCGNAEKEPEEFCEKDDYKYAFCSKDRSRECTSDADCSNIYVGSFSDICNLVEIQPTCPDGSPCTVGEQCPGGSYCPEGAGGTCNANPNVGCSTDDDCPNVDIYKNYGVCLGFNDPAYHLEKEKSCSVDCQTFGGYCGDGIVQIGDDFNNPYEECDDGNTINFDGCNNQCIREEFLSCIADNDLQYFKGQIAAGGERHFFFITRLAEDVFDEFTDYYTDNPGTVGPFYPGISHVEQCFQGATCTGICNGQGMNCSNMYKTQINPNVPDLSAWLNIGIDSILTNEIFNDPGLFVYVIACSGEYVPPGEEQEIEEGECGDGVINEGEACDLGVGKNGIQCVPPYGESCTYCSVDCQNILTVDAKDYCGDNKLDEGYEVCDVVDGKIIGTSDLDAQAIQDICYPDYIVCKQQGHPWCDAVYANCLEENKTKLYECTDKGTVTCQGCANIDNQCVECGIGLDLPTANAAFISPLIGPGNIWPTVTSSIFDPTIALLRKNDPGSAEPNYKFLGSRKIVPTDNQGNINPNFLDVATQEPIDFEIPQFGLQSSTMCNGEYEVFFNYDNIILGVDFLSAIEESRGNMFPYKVEGETQKVNNEFIYSSAVSASGFRVVVRWADEIGEETALAGGVFGDHLEEGGFVNYMKAQLDNNLCGAIRFAGSSIGWVPDLDDGICEVYTHAGSSSNVLTVHPQIGSITNTNIQSFTISMETFGGPTEEIAFVVQALGGRIGSNDYKLKNIYVDVYEYHPGQSPAYSIYGPTRTFIITDAAGTSSNAAAKYWHVFNAVSSDANPPYQYIIEPINSIETDECAVKQNMSPGITALPPGC